LNGKNGKADGEVERILTAPYEERDGWEMNIMCVDGVLYFEEHLDEARLREKCVPFHLVLSYTTLRCP
jgi:RAT1-interacting protein